MTIETLTESEARTEWHAAVKQYGLERCKVERVEVENGSPIYRITVSE